MPATKAKSEHLCDAGNSGLGCKTNVYQCNREWPCNHCQKRKVADRCRFTQDAGSNDKSPAAAKKRARAQQDASDDESDDGQGLEAIGYMHTEFFNSMSLTKEVRLLLALVSPKGHASGLLRHSPRRSPQPANFRHQKADKITEQDEKYLKAILKNTSTVSAAEEGPRLNPLAHNHR